MRRNEVIDALRFRPQRSGAQGLITFKDRWGGRRIQVNYYRAGETGSSSSNSHLAVAVKRFLPSVPDPMFRAPIELRIVRRLGARFFFDQ